jgi:hypothetical protein
MINIKVKKLDGMREEISIDENVLCSELCSRLAQSSGIDPTQIRLINQGNTLKLEETLASQKVQSGHVIHMIIQLRGGAL